MVIHFNTCCCGCSLKTGAVFVGVMEAIGSFISLIGCSVGANNMLAADNGIESVLKDTILNSDPWNPNYEMRVITNEANQHYGSIGIILAICAALSALRLLFDIMLVFGASADNPGLVKPWIVLAIILNVVASVVYVVLIIYLFKMGVSGGGISLLIGAFVAVVLNVYFILVVNSFHTTILQNNTMQMQM